MRLIATLMLACIPLAGCAGTTSLELCKNAETRRPVYAAAIAAADTYAASGRSVPAAIATGRVAAETAIVALDAHCPTIPAPDRPG